MQKSLLFVLTRYSINNLVTCVNRLPPLTISIIFYHGLSPLICTIITHELPATFLKPTTFILPARGIQNIAIQLFINNHVYYHDFRFDVSNTVEPPNKGHVGDNINQLLCLL